MWRLVSHDAIQRGGVRGLRGTHWWQIGRREEAERGGGRLWDWLKGEMVATYFFTQVGAGSGSQQRTGPWEQGGD